MEVDCKQMPSREQLRDELVSTLHADLCKPAGAKPEGPLPCIIRFTHGELCAGLRSDWNALSHKHGLLGQGVTASVLRDSA